MEFGIANIRNGKRHQTEGMQLPNNKKKSDGSEKRKLAST